MDKLNIDSPVPLWYQVKERILANIEDGKYTDGGMLPSETKLCKEYNIEKLIHISALGANVNSSSAYMRSKAKGEKFILDNTENSIILRPSIIFGPEDNFFNQFASLTQFLPFLPLIGGGKNKFQPIYVVDVVKSIISVLENKKSNNKIYELCGPEIFTFRELMVILLKH